MKFCTKCGAELFDEAVICVKCGRMVEQRLAPQAAPPVYAEPVRVQKAAGEASLFLTVSSFVHTLAVALSLFFSMLSLGLAYVSSYASTTPNYYSSGSALRSVSVTVSTYFYPDSDLLVPAIIFAGVSFIFGTIAFIMTLVERHRGERLFSGISRLVIGALALTGSIVLMNS